MKQVLLFLLLIASTNVTAQLSYEVLDTYAQFISDRQAQADNHTFRDSGKNYNISFAEKSFVIRSHNGLASQAVYLHDGEREVLKLYEGIDFAKATSLVRKDTYKKNAGAIRVSFAKGSISVTEYVDGRKKSAGKTGTVDFFFAANPANPSLWSNDGKELFHKLVELIYARKMAAGDVDADGVELVSLRWEKALSLFTSAGFQDFIDNTGNGLFAEQATILKNGLLLKEEKNRMLNARMDSIAHLHKFKFGINGTDFRKINKEADEMMTYKNGKASGFRSYERRYNGVGKPWPEGVQGVSLVEGNIALYSYVLMRDKKDRAPVAKLFESMKASYSGAFEAGMITSKGDEFTVTSPDKTRVISVQLLGIFGSTSLLISFSGKG